MLPLFTTDLPVAQSPYSATRCMYLTLHNSQRVKKVILDMWMCFCPSVTSAQGENYLCAFLLFQFIHVRWKHTTTWYKAGTSSLKRDSSLTTQIILDSWTIKQQELTFYFQKQWNSSYVYTELFRVIWPNFMNPLGSSFGAENINKLLLLESSPL
jgi:hypothetical protein